jgi:nitrate reductase gamma subunit
MTMYEFVRGPLVWIAFFGFAVGVLYRLVSMAQLARRDKVVYPTFDARYGARSLLHWLIPFSSRSTRMRPLYTAISYAFHVCVVITPLFVMGHAVLWKESWGIRWWSLPQGLADVMTLVVICACIFFIIRRLVRPEVRNVSTGSDVLLALLVMAPFLTGFAAHKQWLAYEPLLVAHIIAGAAWLLLIPWTRLVHMIWFAVTRAYMGSEFGSVRHARDW